MPFEEPLFQTTNPYKKEGITMEVYRTIYYGEVISIDDNEDGGRIKVKVIGIDDNIINDNLPWCYPLLPRFFHIYPQIGEIVRVLIEDIKNPEKNRYWIGSVISQSHKIGFDNAYSAFSTSTIPFIKSDTSYFQYPDAKDVFPEKEDIGIIGRVNTDILLKKNEVLIRAGKHDNNDIFKLNVTNPGIINLKYEQINSNEYSSNVIIMADKIGIISHSGNPQFKHARLEIKDKEEIFNNGHPIPRGDILIKALEIMRDAIINHIHGYSNLPADKSFIINELEKINFEEILQNNIVVN